MRIIIDGCDWTGKSTLAKFIAERYNLSLQSFSYPRTKDAFEEFSPFYGKSTWFQVFDRCWLSEIIYGKLKGRPPFTEKQKEFFQRSTKKDIYIIATSDIDAIKNVFETRGEDYINLEEADKVNSFFKNYFIYLQKHKVIQYDFMQYQNNLQGFCETHLDKIFLK